MTARALAHWGVAPAAPSFPDLLIRPKQEDGESAGGYALRLAWRNGLVNPMWMDGVVGCSVASTGLGRARWCPACLATCGAIWKAEWNAGPGICTVHCCWLADACARCHEQSSWRSLRFLACRCDLDLRDAECAPLSSHVLNLVEVATNGADGDWRGLTLLQRWRLARLLGALDNHGLHGKPGKRASVTTVASEKRYVTAGARILCGASTEIDELFVRLRGAGAVSRGSDSVNNALPGLLIKLRQQLGAKERNYVLDRLRAHVSASADGEHAMSWRQNETAAPTTATAVAKALRVRPERVRALLVATGEPLSMRTTAAGRTMHVIGPEVASRLREQLGAVISKSVASKRYGLSIHRIEALAGAGLLRRSLLGVDERSVGELIVEVGRHIQLGDIDGLLTLTQAMRLLVPRAATVAFLKSLLAGELPIKAVLDRPNSLREIYVHRSDVTGAAADDDGAGRVADGRPLLSVPEFAMAYGFKQEVAYHLVKVGLLRTVEDCIGRRTARFIEPTEATRFHSDVTSLAEAARAGGVGSRASLAWARRIGLDVLSGPSVDGGRQYFVRKLKH